MPSSTRPRTPNRPATEAALQTAALDLLERNGVLAGLNLREVADEAGVNRGLVYHYFGTRATCCARPCDATSSNASPTSPPAGRVTRRRATSGSSARRSATGRRSSSRRCSSSTATRGSG